MHPILRALGPRFLRSWHSLRQTLRPLRPDVSGVLGASYNGTVIREANRPWWRTPSLPLVIFALAFVLLGWVASHSISYALVDLASHGHHDHREPHVHDYLNVLKLVGGGGLVIAFSLRETVQ